MEYGGLLVIKNSQIGLCPIDEIMDFELVGRISGPQHVMNDSNFSFRSFWKCVVTRSCKHLNSINPWSILWEKWSGKSCILLSH